MKDNKTGLEGHLGLGTRKIINNNFILGGYGLGDMRRSKDKKKSMYQVNTRAELFYDRLEIRVNGYFPMTSRVALDQSSSSIDVNYDLNKNQTVEIKSNSQTNARREY